MACYNHPNAPTAAHCNRCGLEMCGMCAQFLDQGEYCEKCADIVRNEEFVKTQTRELNKPEIESIHTEAEEEETFKPPTRSKDKDKVFIWLGVGGSSTMIFLSLLLYSFPLMFESAEAAQARENAQALESCRLVFEQIGHALETGQNPDASLTCADTNIPNLISRTGDDIVISHPNPGFYGLSDLYVTSRSHRVILVN